MDRGSGRADSTGGSVTTIRKYLEALTGWLIIGAWIYGVLWI